MRKFLIALLAMVLSVTLAPVAQAEPIFLSYRAHVQLQGWQEWRNEPSAMGTSGQSLRLEAVQLRGGVGQVSAHVQDIGWMPYVNNGSIAGTTGQEKRLEAIKVRSEIPGWKIECQAHVQDIGWMAWVGNDKTCGTTGQNKRVEAIRLRLVAVDVPAPTPTPTATPTAPVNNTPIDQKAMLIGYDHLKAQEGQTVIKASDAGTVAINNADYNTARGQLAYRDADVTRLSYVTEALPSKIEIYLAELTNEGKLPKFRALLANGAEKMQLPDSSSDDAKDYFNVTRPVNMPDSQIKKVPGADSAYSSVGTSKSFPSGHARRYQMVGASLAVMLPEYAPQLLARGADGGHSRIVLGVHSQLDVIGGKAVGTRVVAQRLSDETFRKNTFDPAMNELRTGLEAKCGTTIALCAQGSNTSASKAEYTQRLTYGLPRIGSAGKKMSVPAGAEAILSTKFPNLTAEQRKEVIAKTAIDSGYPLDLSGLGYPSRDTGWSRINLAEAMTANVTVVDGQVVVG